MPEYVHDQYVLQLSKAGGGGAGLSTEESKRKGKVL